MPKVIIEDYTNTWKLVTILATLICLSALAVFAFQQRAPIVEALTGQKVFLSNLKSPIASEESQEELQKFVNAHSLVVGINIGRADFEYNTRESTYDFSKVPEINNAWKRSAGVSTVLFGDDIQNNERVVKLINGQFVCARTSEITTAKRHPALARYSKATCSVAIPPGYGDFVGWINIYLYESPTFSQMEALQSIAEDLARDIYERDILKRPRKNQGSANDLSIQILP